MRRVFFVSLFLVVCAFALVCVMLRFSPEQPRTADPIDAQTTVTVLQAGQVRTLPLSDWLWGVLAAEMPASVEPEALRAQAVAARTYILERQAHRPSAHPDADVCDDPACCTAWYDAEAMAEKWGAEAEANTRRVSAAVADTDGEILTYDGAPIRAVFHSSSAGQTESSAALWGAVPYLVSVSTPETAEDVPNYVAVTELSPDELRRTVLEAYPDCVFSEDPAAWLATPEYDAAGRVSEQTIGSVTLTGPELRALLGLRSTAYTAEYQDGVFRFTTTGYGHGAGMSQYGANVMARQGSGYAEILEHYYPGSTLCKLNIP